MVVRSAAYSDASMVVHLAVHLVECWVAWMDVIWVGQTDALMVVHWVASRDAMWVVLMDEWTVVLSADHWVCAMAAN